MVCGIIKQILNISTLCLLMTSASACSKFKTYDHSNAIWNQASIDGVRPKGARPINIVLGSAPKEMVTRYVATYSYKGPGGSYVNDTMVVGADGGVLSGVIIPDGNNYPDNINVSIVTDYAPGLSLISDKQSHIIPVSDEGVIEIFEPKYQEGNGVHLLLIMPNKCWWHALFAKDNDFLVVGWSQKMQNEIVRKQIVIGDNALKAKPLVDIFLPLTKSPDLPVNVDISINGKYYDHNIETYSICINPIAETSLSLLFIYNSKLKTWKFTEYGRMP